MAPVSLEFKTPFWSLGGDPNTDILGKLIMVHETGDTFLTNPHAQHYEHAAGYEHGHADDTNHISIHRGHPHIPIPMRR